MFFHPNDNKLSLIVKHLIAFFALFSMVILLVYMVMQGANIKQEEKIIAIDITGKVNICLPQYGEFEEESFFSF